MRRILSAVCAVSVACLLNGCQPASLPKPKATKVVSQGPESAAHDTEMKSGTNAGTREGRATLAEFKQAVETGDIPEQAVPADRRFVAPSDLGEEVVKVFQPVRFSFDSYEVGPKYKDTLKLVAAYLLDHPDVLVIIEGHCDERGTEAYNLALGEHRALSVRKFLVMGGVSPKRLFTASYGAAKPALSDHTEDAWSKNRRCEFLLSPK
jgi:peptidoglycan-associated lipoprotein